MGSGHAGGASAQSREPGMGVGGSPGLLSGCWQPESPSPARPATGQEGQSSHVRHPAQPFLRQLSGRAARRSQQACCIALAQPSTPGRQSCSLSPECPSCGAARDPQVWGRRGECSAPWVFSLCHVGSGFSVYLGYAAVPDVGSETLPGVRPWPPSLSPAACPSAPPSLCMGCPAPPHPHPCWVLRLAQCLCLAAL